MSSRKHKNKIEVVRAKLGNGTAFTRMLADESKPPTKQARRRNNRKNRSLAFGKFKGVLFDSVPNWYLMWALREIRALTGQQRREIKRVLKQRGEAVAELLDPDQSKPAVNKHEDWGSLDLEYQQIVR